MHSEDNVSSLEINNGIYIILDSKCLIHKENQATFHQGSVGVYMLFHVSYRHY